MYNQPPSQPQPQYNPFEPHAPPPNNNQVPYNQPPQTLGQPNPYANQQNMAHQPNPIPAYDPYAQGSNTNQTGIDPYNDNGLSSKLSTDSRMGFIRKVYGILCAQLCLTAGYLIVVTRDPQSFQRFYQNHLPLVFVAIFIYMITLYAIGCYKSVARKVPLNYILLFLFTASMSFICGVSVSFSEPQDVMIAAIMTCSIVIGLTAYAVTTKTDFSYCNAFMWGLVICVLCATFLSIFIHSRLLSIWISALVVLLLCVFIIYDTQLIIGKHSLKYSIDDYVFAAMVIYIDIMRLFLEILKILGKK